MVRHEHLAIQPVHTELARVRGFVTDACTRDGAGRDVADRLALAAHEVCANVIDHGRPATPIEVSFRQHAGVARLLISDDGEPFDPRAIPRAIPRPIPRADLEADDPRPILHADRDARTRPPIGGLGWHLVVHAVDAIDYAHELGRNRLTLAIRNNARRASPDANDGVT